MSQGESLSVPSVRTTAEIELDLFLQETAYPALGQLKYGKLMELVEQYGMAHYGRGYVQGGRDEARR